MYIFQKRAYLLPYRRGKQFKYHIQPNSGRKTKQKKKKKKKKTQQNMKTRLFK